MNSTAVWRCSKLWLRILSTIHSMSLRTKRTRLCDGLLLPPLPSPHSRLLRVTSYVSAYRLRNRTHANIFSLVGDELRRVPRDPHIFRLVCLVCRYPDVDRLSPPLHVARHYQSLPQNQQDGVGAPGGKFSLILMFPYLQTDQRRQQNQLF